ncbi:hypothetical protein Ancab_038883 [Ancistrocladus abbreviatus]
MADHLVLSVDHLSTPENLQPLQGAEISESSSGGSSCHAAESCLVIREENLEEHDVSSEDQPLIQVVECRICQEEDSIKNLEIPCACSGSLKFAHRECVQRWCNEKGNITCEICHQPYAPGYTAPPPTLPEETTIDISGGWTISGAPLDLNDPRLLAVAAAERQLLEADYNEYADTNASGAAFCRSVALVLLALLLLRHALALTDPDGEDDLSTFFSLFLLRAAGFLLPCYIMAWAMSVIQRRSQREEVAQLTASEVAYVLHTGQHTGLQVTIAPGPAAIHHQEPHQ